MHISIQMILLLQACTRPVSPSTPAVPEPIAFRVSPAVIEMGAFYSGAAVRVEGVVENGSKALVTVVGSDREERFNKKGRVGPIWLNDAKVQFSGVPSLFLRFSAEPVRTVLARSEIDELHLDEKSIMQRMRIEPHLAEGDDTMRADFLALKHGDGSYQFGNTGVRMGEPGKDGTPFSLEFAWPRKAPPATYQVRVYEIRNGAVTRRSAMPLRVVRAGFPAWLAAFSQRRASVYGVAALVIAVLAGFGIDFITLRLFGKKRHSVH